MGLQSPIEPGLLLGCESPCPCSKQGASPGMGTTMDGHHHPPLRTCWEMIFTSVGLTRNPGLSPGNLSKQHFVETGSFATKKKKLNKLSFGFAKLTFSDTRKHVVKKKKNFPTTLLGMCSLPPVPKAGALGC